MNHALPGEDLIEAGLRDLREGRESIAGLLVAIGSPRLRRLGLDLPADLPNNPEHRLYHLLAKDDSDSAHSRYNACLRHLIIFEHSAEHALRPLSSNPRFRSLVEKVVSIDFKQGASAIRTDLKRLQSL
jgi:hypothetical protein